MYGNETAMSHFGRHTHFTLSAIAFSGDPFDFASTDFAECLKSMKSFLFSVVYYNITPFVVGLATIQILIVVFARKWQLVLEPCLYLFVWLIAIRWVFLMNDLVLWLLFAMPLLVSLFFARSQYKRYHSISEGED